MLTATNRSNIKISKEIELKRFSEKTSKFIYKFKTIFLYGELGVGKTTFAKYLINNLQKKEKIKITEIPSPTFNLVYEYKIKKFKTIFLYGELGVGKTTFAKYLINNLQKHEKTRITEYQVQHLI